MEFLKSVSQKVVLSTALAAALISPTPAPAGEVCRTLDKVRIQKIRLENEAVAEGRLVKETLRKLRELEDSTGDVHFSRFMEVGGGAVVLSLTYAFSWKNAKEAGRYYENSYHLFGRLIKKSPSFAFFTAMGSYAIVEGTAKVVVHHRNISKFRNELELRKTALLRKSNVLNEKIEEIKFAMKSANCELPIKEVTNSLEQDEILIDVTIADKKRAAELKAQAALTKAKMEGDVKGVQLYTARLNCAYVEEDYLAFNPDVAEAVKAGSYPDGKNHFDQAGKAEGRLFNYNCLQGPGKDNSCVFSEAHYLELHPDVAAGVEAKSFTAAGHYGTYGRKEGRQFNKNCK